MALATGVLVALVHVPAASRSSQGIVVKSGANFEYPTSKQDYVDRSEIVISGTIVNHSRATVLQSLQPCQSLMDVSEAA